MAEPASDLFEFGKVLVETENLQVLYSKIPKLINDIMMSDACELAIIEGERITEQIFEGLEPQEPQQSSSLDISKSIHHETYQSGDAFIASDLNRDPQFAEKEDAHLYPYHSYMGKSLKSLGRPSMLIAVYRNDQEQWSEDDINKFQFLMDQTEFGLQHAQAMKELETQARTDELTGLANYAYFSERMDQEFARARRHNIPLSLIVVDMDHFKKINDESGHAVGDELLQHLASVLLNTTLAELLAHADEALYFAKSKGRGSSFHYSNIPHPA